MDISTSPVRNWAFPVTLHPRDDRPLFLQIARAIADDIRRGRLKPGSRLPGTRDLATTLSVHRNTVVAAYHELYAEGWTEPTAARGTFVSRHMPEVRPRGFSATHAGVPAHAGFPLRAPAPPIDPMPPGMLLMPGGIPDVRLAPVVALARAYRRAVRRHAASVLAYGDPHGHPRLRTAIAAMLAATRGLAATGDDVIVTRGSQMALHLVARALVAPGDAVAVEDLGYRPAWEAFRSHGAHLVPVRVDHEGMDVAALTEIARRQRLRAVYVTPHHHYPTMVTLSAPRRLALLELARRERIAIIEDDYDHEFHYDGRPILPLASADPAGVVVYIGTLAKILAPGLRLGYAVAPRDLLERITAHRFYVDRQGDHAVEAAVAELLEDGEVQRHARRARRVYQSRRDLLVDAFRRKLAAVLEFDVPPGGMALWTKVAAEVDVDAWAARAFTAGVLFLPGGRFTFDERRMPYARFGFAALDEREQADAVRRLVKALPYPQTRRR
jgi:GntR family transcriptional regulator / MocR family aminotransferase